MSTHLNRNHVIKLKNERQMKGITLKEIATSIGATVSALSQFENAGKNSINLIKQRAYEYYILNMPDKFEAIKQKIDNQ